MWFSRTDRTLIHQWKVEILLSLPFFCLFITFLSLVVILCLEKRHSFCLYDDCNVKTRIYKSLVTETSIFKCCLLSWCFHLHTQNEDGCGCWRPLNGRVLTVWGLSWSHSIHLLPCYSSSSGCSPVRGHLSAFSLLLRSSWLFQNTSGSCWAEVAGVV